MNLLSESARVHVDTVDDLEAAAKVLLEAFQTVGLEATVTQKPKPRAAEVDGPKSPGAVAQMSFDFEVLGMKCGSCVQKAEKAVRALVWPEARGFPKIHSGPFLFFCFVACFM